MYLVPSGHLQGICCQSVSQHMTRAITNKRGQERRGRRGEEKGEERSGEGKEERRGDYGKRGEGEGGKSGRTTCHICFAEW